MTIFKKIDTAIGNYLDHPRGKHIAILFSAAAIGAAGMIAGLGGAESVIRNTRDADILGNAKGEALIRNCMRDKEASMRTIMSATPITIGPAFIEIARAECLQDHDIREKSVQDDMAYRSYVLLEGMGLTLAVMGTIGAVGGVALRAARALKR